MKNILRKIRIAFSWEFIFKEGAYRYYENKITKERKFAYCGRGYSTINWKWLAENVK